MVLSSDTPARPKRFIKTELASNLRTSRTAAVEDVGDSVPQISLDAYFDHHLPQLPPTLSGDGFGTVLAKVLSCAYGQQRWNAFPKNPIQTNNEGLVFGGLIAIADTIRTTVSDLFPDLEPTTVFSNAPDNVPQSTWKTNATRPDGYLILRQRQSPGRPHWMDIAFPGEYKRSDKIEAQNDDIEKTIWSIHHIMRDDPRRRFVNAFTVENKTMRLWHASRSEVLVSDAFDFQQEPERLVRLFVSLMYAKQDALGWDPTMLAVKAGDDFQYDIELPKHTVEKPRVCRTEDLLSSISATSIRGRGTRVWRARMLDAAGNPYGEPFVLKDSWPDSDRPREGDVLAAIGKDIDPEVFAESFLTVMEHGDVHIGGKPDQTLDEAQRDAIKARPDAPAGKRFRVKQLDLSPKGIEKQERTRASRQDELRSSHLASDSGTREEYQNQYVTYHTKSHYRIAFKEVCEALHDQKILGEVFGALGDTCRTLEHLHNARWVHRDISSGNILLYKPKDRVPRIITKLSDVEYTKQFSTGGENGQAHEIRTGTEEFMSIEARTSMYRFQPEQERKPVSNMLNSNNAPTLPSKAVISAIRHRRAGGSKDPIWFYNPLHDLESVWWLMAFFLFTKDFKVEYASGTQPIPEYMEPPEQRVKRITLLEKFAADLFVTGLKREDIFRFHTSLDYGLNHLPPFLQEIGLLLDDAQLWITNAYKSAEKHYPVINPRVEPEVYQQLQCILAEMKAWANNTELKYTVKIDRSIYAVARRLLRDAQEAQAPVSKPTKRKQGDDATDAADGAQPDPSSTSTIGASASGSKKARTDTV